MSENETQKKPQTASSTGQNNDRSNEILATAYMGDGAATYDKVRFTTTHGLVFHDLEMAQLKKVISLISKGSEILEVGCGTARFSCYLAQNGYNVVALDPSPDMLSIAKKKCEGLNNIKFVQAEGAALQFSDCKFDFVFAIRVINSTESVPYAIQTIEEMIRVTKEEGLILIEFANASRPFAKLNNSVRLSFKDLRKIAKDLNCEVVYQSGVLVFSQTILNKLPSFLLPLWKAVESFSASLFWPVTSRGYIVFKRNKKG